jgi:serine protease Do
MLMAGGAMQANLFEASIVRRSVRKLFEAIRAVTVRRFLFLAGALAAAVGMLVPPLSSQGQEPEECVRAISNAFRDVARRIGPSVVTITAVQKTDSEMGGGLPGLPFDFFGGEGPFRRFFESPMPREFLVRGIGSGVIVDGGGNILTNYHVVSDAERITVITPEKRKLTAQLVGVDPKTDLAVVRVDARLAPARWGDSNKLHAGQWVVAVGNPFNLEQTITAGIVSATGRSNVGIADYEDFIQTDAAINPGNSGGPLVNLDAEVVGINAAIFSRSGGFMGIGFAIPSNMARAVVTSLIKEGRVVRGFLGVNIQDLTEELAESFGYDSTAGALVSAVVPGSPADKAGMQQGDIIMSLGGERIEDASELKRVTAAIRPGRDVEVEIFRNGRVRSTKVTVTELKIETEQKSEPVPQDREWQRLGLQVETFTRSLAAQLGLEHAPGVIVIRVSAGGLAQLAGLQVGDVIVEVNEAKIRNSEDFARALRKGDLEKGVRLNIRRGESQFFVMLKSME